MFVPCLVSCLMCPSLGCVGKEQCKRSSPTSSLLGDLRSDSRTLATDSLTLSQQSEAAAPWPRLQLSSARPGFPRYELRSRGSRPGLRWTYPIAKAHDCAPGRRRPRPRHHLEVTRSFSANVGCACASVQASRPGFPGDRPKLQWLISLNRRTRTTQSMVPACQTRYSGA